MDYLKEILPPKIFETVDRAGICTVKQILVFSIWDIKKKTGLPTVDIKLLKNIVAGSICPPSISCNKLLAKKLDRIKTGCTAIDNLLNGGFRRGVLTEIYGESASGKTQLGMHVAAHNASQGSVYICTEDLFPVKRYNQIQESISDSAQNLGNNVFVEHVYEAPDLLSCVRLRLPRLLEQHKNISVVIVDSIAASFRCESTNYIQRAEDLRELAVSLIRIAQDHSLAVVCINQVTSAFDDSSRVLPSLGLAWSNMISYRLWLSKIAFESTDDHPDNLKDKMALRELTTIFAPDLPNDSCKFTITSKGITNLYLNNS